MAPSSSPSFPSSSPSPSCLTPNQLNSSNLTNIRVLIVHDVDLKSAARLAEFALRDDDFVLNAKGPPQQRPHGGVDLCVACGPFTNHFYNDGTNNKGPMRTAESNAASEGMVTCILSQLENIVCRVVFVPDAILDPPSTMLRDCIPNWHNNDEDGVGGGVTGKQLWERKKEHCNSNRIQPGDYNNDKVSARMQFPPWKRFTPNSRNVQLQWLHILPGLGVTGFSGTTRQFQSYDKSEHTYDKLEPSSYYKTSNTATTNHHNEVEGGGVVEGAQAFPYGTSPTRKPASSSSHTTNSGGKQRRGKFDKAVHYNSPKHNSSKPPSITPNEEAETNEGECTTISTASPSDGSNAHTVLSQLLQLAPQHAYSPTITEHHPQQQHHSKSTMNELSQAIVITSGSAPAPDNQNNPPLFTQQQQQVLLHIAAPGSETFSHQNDDNVEISTEQDHNHDETTSNAEPNTTTTTFAKNEPTVVIPGSLRLNGDFVLVDFTLCSREEQPKPQPPPKEEQNINTNVEEEEGTNHEKELSSLSLSSKHPKKEFVASYTNPGYQWRIENVHYRSMGTQI